MQVISILIFNSLVLKSLVGQGHFESLIFYRGLGLIIAVALYFLVSSKSTLQFSNYKIQISRMFLGGFGLALNTYALKGLETSELAIIQFSFYLIGVIFKRRSFIIMPVLVILGFYFNIDNHFILSGGGSFFLFISIRFQHKTFQDEQAYLAGAFPALGLILYGMVLGGYEVQANSGLQVLSGFVMFLSYLLVAKPASKMNFESYLKLQLSVILLTKVLEDGFAYLNSPHKLLNLLVNI